MSTMGTMEPDLSPIRWKLTRRYFLISGFVLLVFGTSVFVEVSRARSLLLREQVKQLASSAASQMPLILHEAEEYRLANGSIKITEPPNLAVVDAQPTSIGPKKIVLLDKQMNLLSQNGSMPLDVAAVRPTRNLDQRQDLMVPGGVAYWRPVYLRESVGANRQLEGYVLSALSTAGADRELTRLRGGLLFGGGIGALAAALLSQWMVGTSLRPIREQINRLVRFTSDASHELRHPLTAIRAVIGSTREGGYLSGVDPELSRKFSLIDNATAEMSSLVEDLLLLTRLDRALPEEHHWIRFDLCELVEDLAALYQDRATAQQVRVTQSLVAPTWINGNADQLRRLISNLLVNALQYTPAGGTVALGVMQKGHHAMVTVEDQGPGIPIEQRELIFERFWQAEASRTGPNSGLGLSIARSIALVHGGSIEAQTASGGGCRMVVQLPAAG